MANNYNSRKERRQQLNRRKAKNKKSKFAGSSKIKKIIAIILIAGVIIGLGVTALFAYYASNAPELKASELQAPFSSKVYDMDDDFVLNIGGEERRTRVNYEDLPETYVNSVLATEDVRFFEHSGIDLRRILAAIWANITEGFGSEGASTITQQVIKQSLLTSDKTLERKVQEQYLALKLDREYEKERIFEMYVNKIYFGQGAYGVAEAAKTYFNKSDLSELTLAESALLAGLPQRPSGYDPYENPELAKDRMSTVLHLMVSHGKISEEEAEKARQTDISSMLAEQTEKTKKYQAFVDQVQKEVESKMEDVNIFKDGLKIYTTLDPEAQQLTQKAMNGEGPVSWPTDSLQSAVSVVDTQTGAIRAIGGGRNYVSGGLNFATDDPRQAGSTMKPIAAYGPVIEHEKWSTYHQLKDEETDFNGYSPSNFDDEYRGWMSIREALAQSINIPAVKALDAVGPSRASDFANKLGISFGEGPMELGDALGTQEVTPIQMSGAYAAFGNEGVYNEPYTVRKVETPDNGTVDLTPEPVSAMKDYTAYMVTSMLKTAVESGTGTAAKVPGLPMAGKTGTTNKEVDAWFNGYTTDYSISVWTGNQDRSSIENESGKDVPKQMFRHLMGELSEDKDTEDFKQPDSVVEVGVEEGSRPAKLPSSYTPSSEIVTELFHVDNQPSDVSAQYQQMDPVSGLSASYDKDSDSIDVTWSYPESADFYITATGGNSTSTGDTSYEISSPEPGKTYDISVTVLGDGSSSDSDSKNTSVQVPEQESEPAEESTEDEQSSEDEENSSEEENSEDEENSSEEENEDSGSTGNNEDNNTNEDSGNESDAGEENEDSGSGNEGTDNENNGSENGGSDSQNNDADSPNNESDSQNNDSGNSESDSQNNGSGNQNNESDGQNNEAPEEDSSSGAQNNNSESEGNGSDSQNNSSSEGNNSSSQNESGNSDSPEEGNSGTDSPSDNSSDEQYNGSSEEGNSDSGQESNQNSDSSGEGSGADAGNGSSDSAPASQEDSGNSEQDPAPSSSNNSGGSSEGESSDSGQESNQNSGSSGEGSGADAGNGSSSNSSEQSSETETPATGSDNEESNGSSGSYNSSSERNTESSPEQNSGSDAQEESSDPASGTGDSNERSSNADSETPDTSQENSESPDENSNPSESDSNSDNQTTTPSETEESSTQKNSDRREDNDSTD
ncbi:PBP1A family penicillin-binding protein [Salimicrobium album]|uniref:Penicillin-binding protein 1A n=1 Tax=Salimicrobium album TaxID=50717 RepID=A0A1H3E2T0_9BACI|nr:PBP1A family penicillin-binding protein [Salimicrobium album]SDX72598.1 penicillin-binding protein 1A [Salimicrobium album]